jgi:hypothetical protein
MMFRWPFRGATLALGLLLSLNVGVPAGWACEGAECPAEGKPLDLKKFLREQAASTRTPEAMDQTRGKASHHQRSTHSRAARGKSAQARHTHRIVTSQSEHHSKSAAPARDIAATSPVQPPAQDDVQVVSANDVNDIDRAAKSQAAETTGKASEDAQATQSGAPNVQMVVASDFNEIDRKAAERNSPAPAAAAVASETALPKQAPPQSWIHWLWSAIGAGFLALAGVARYPAA